MCRQSRLHSRSRSRISRRRHQIADDVVNCRCVASMPTLVVDLPNGWQERRGSNPQPPVLETGALPIELHSYDARPPDDCSYMVTTGRFTTKERRGVSTIAANNPAKRPLPKKIFRQWPNSRTTLLDDLRNDAGADGTAAFADGEAQAFVHGDRGDQRHRHGRRCRQASPSRYPPAARPCRSRPWSGSRTADGSC